MYVLIGTIKLLLLIQLFSYTYNMIDDNINKQQK